MACLARAGEAVRGVVDALRTADATTADRAPDVVATLPEIEACAREPPGPLPRSPEAEALRLKLMEIPVQVATGRFEDAVARTDGIRERVDAAGDPSLIVEHGSQRAKALEGLARHSETHAEFLRALEAAHDARDDRQAARIATWLAWNVGIYRSRPREGLDWVRTAEAAVARVPEDPALRAEILNARGVIRSLRSEPM